MEISKDIEIVNCGLFLRKERILIINDLHIGYEEVHKKPVASEAPLSLHVVEAVHHYQKTYPCYHITEDYRVRVG